MTDEIIQIAEQQLTAQEFMITRNIPMRGYKIKRYKLSWIETPKGYKFTKNLIIHPIDDESIVENMLFEQAALLYQAVVLKIDVELQKEPDTEEC